MSEVKHTPGPWIIGNSGTSVYALGDEGSNRFYLHIDTWVDRKHQSEKSVAEAEANAHLIAAAPDLLAALRAFDHGETVHGTHSPGVACTQCAARRAIAKAEGRA